MTVPRLLLILAVISAAMHLVAHYRGQKRLVYVFKPLTTILLIFLAAVLPAHDEGYRLAIVIGLVWSLAGDIFLMLPRDRFVAGLVSFLIALITYTIAFSGDVSFGSRPLLLLPYLVATLVILSLLWPRLGKLRLPVVIYVGALASMAWQAATRAAVIGTTPACAAAVGAALFVVSDATLAVDRFRRPFRAAQAIVMTTYWAAQALIAYSVTL